MSLSSTRSVSAVWLPAYSRSVRGPTRAEAISSAFAAERRAKRLLAGRTECTKSAVGTVGSLAIGQLRCFVRDREPERLDEWFDDPAAGVVLGDRRDRDRVLD